MAKLTMATTALAKRRETLKTQPIFAVFLAISLSEGQFLWRPSTYFISRLRQCLLIIFISISSRKTLKLSCRLRLLQQVAVEYFRFIQTSSALSCLRRNSSSLILGPRPSAFHWRIFNDSHNLCGTSFAEVSTVTPPKTLLKSATSLRFFKDAILRMVRW